MFEKYFRERRKRKVLKWVNEQRKIHNLNGEVGPAGKPLAELPRGRPGDSNFCVIARALDGNTQRWRTSAAGHVFILHPNYVAEFIHEFDRREYEELIDWTV